MPKGSCSRIRNGSGSLPDHGSDSRLPGLSRNGNSDPSNGVIKAKAKREMKTAVTEVFMVRVGMEFDVFNVYVDVWCLNVSREGGEGFGGFYRGW